MVRWNVGGHLHSPQLGAMVRIEEMLIQGWVGLLWGRASYRSKVPGRGCLPYLPLGLNHLTVWFQGQMDYEQLGRHCYACYACVCRGNGA